MSKMENDTKKKLISLFAISFLVLSLFINGVYASDSNFPEIDGSDYNEQSPPPQQALLIIAIVLIIIYLIYWLIKHKHIDYK